VVQISANLTTTTTTAGTSSKSHVGAIVGGVIGGLAALIAISTITFITWRRRRQDPASAGYSSEYIQRHPEVAVTPFNPMGSTVTCGTAVSDAASQATEQQQQQLVSSSEGSSSPSFLRVPAGLSGKELAQLRSTRSQPSQSPNSESAPNTSPPAATTDRSSAVPPSQDQRPWQSDVESLRREMEQLRAERLEPEAPPSYFTGEAR
jgi:hypothetical protein